MSGGSDKTEKPTQRRIQDAREKGQVAKSMDFNAAVVLGTATLMMTFAGSYTFNSLFGITRQMLGHLVTKPMTVDGFNELYTSGIYSIVLVLMPFLIGIAVMGALGNLAQVKPLFTTHPLIPKLDKLNPLNGFKRICSMRSVVEVVKAIIKMTVIGWAGWAIISGRQQELMAMSSMDLPLALGVLTSVTGQIMFWSVVIYLVLGIADWWYQSYELEKQLRMSKQDIKDERKNTDGDPHIKAKVRQMGQQLVRKRQLSNVPTADVIITNPTHYSIAIKYDPDMAPAPRVVAKGVDHFAMKIREVANANGVPLVENRPLARSLYAAVEVEHMIPPELFVAVAEVLAYVYAKNKGRKLASKPARPVLTGDDA